MITAARPGSWYGSGVPIDAAGPGTGPTHASAAVPGEGGSPGPPGRHRRIGRATAAFAGLLVGSALVATVHVGGGAASAVGSDFRVFYGAARLLAAGANPYHGSALLHLERLLTRGHSHVRSSSTYEYLPIVALLVVPLTALRFWSAYAVFTTIAVMVTIASVFALARGLGWRRPAVPAVLTPLLWASLNGYLMGQLDAFLLGVLASALLLRLRLRVLAAGAVLGLAWLKPQLLIPAVPLLALSCWPDRRRVVRVLAGFVGCSVAIALVQIALIPSSLAAWWGSLVGFTQALPTLHARLAGLVGLFADIPRALRPSDAVTGYPSLVIAGTGALVALAVALRLAARRAQRGGADPGAVVLAVGLPMAIWLLVIPYDRAYDLVLLAPVALVVIGRDGAGLHRPAAWVMWAGVAILPYFDLLDHSLDLVPLAVAAVCLAGWWSKDSVAGLGPAPAPAPRADEGAGAAVLAAGPTRAAAGTSGAVPGGSASGDWGTVR